MKTWDQFYPFVLPKVIGCPNLTANFYIKQAAIEFLMESHAWVDTLAAVNTVFNQQAYAFGAPATQQVLDIRECRIAGGDPLDLGYDEEILKDTAAGTPTRIWTTDLVNFNLWRVPAVAAQQIVNKVVLAPSQAATGVEDRIFALHFKDIANRALQRLLELPGKPWTDPVLAKAYGDMVDPHHASVQAKRGGARLRTKVASI